MRYAARKCVQGRAPWVLFSCPGNGLAIILAFSLAFVVASTTSSTRNNRASLRVLTTPDALPVLTATKIQNLAITTGTVDTDDGDILCYFYSAATNKAALTNWCGTKSGGNYVNGPCTGANVWHGVTCINGRVTRVDLYSAGVYGSNGLGGGSIPAELGGLTGLTFLNLKQNSLSGSIPSQLGLLTGLTYLGLYGNQLGGTIPTQLGALPLLSHLALNNNQLVGIIPTSFCGFPSTNVLRVASNPGITCYPQCLSANTVFMTGRGRGIWACTAGTHPP